MHVLCFVRGRIHDKKMSETARAPAPVLRFRNYRPSAETVARDSGADAARAHFSQATSIANGATTSSTAPEPELENSSVAPAIIIVKAETAPSLLFNERSRAGASLLPPAISLRPRTEAAAPNVDSSIVPRKSNWDLKRDMEADNSTLSAATNAAIAVLVRRKIATSRARDVGVSTAESLAGVAGADTASGVEALSSEAVHAIISSDAWGDIAEIALDDSTANVTR